jgi:hypothetical protein
MKALVYFNILFFVLVSFFYFADSSIFSSVLLEEAQEKMAKEITTQENTRTGTLLFPKEISICNDSLVEFVYVYSNVNITTKSIYCGTDESNYNCLVLTNIPQRPLTVALYAKIKNLQSNEKEKRKNTLTIHVDPICNNNNVGIVETGYYFPYYLIKTKEEPFYSVILNGLTNEKDDEILLSFYPLNL